MYVTIANNEREVQYSRQVLGYGRHDRTHDVVVGQTHQMQIETTDPFRGHDMYHRFRDRFGAPPMRKCRIRMHSIHVSAFLSDAIQSQATLRIRLLQQRPVDR